VKAAPFAYARPGSVADALVELSHDGAKVLAGGQSLVPVLAMRLAQPTTLVDINSIGELGRIDQEQGGVRIGANVRQRQVQQDDVAAAIPLLRMALPWVGHRELRSRGTVCGSLAHADPAAELPAVACCLEASVTIAGTNGERVVAATDFFTAAMTTTVQPDELVTSVRFPTAGAAEGFGFAEVARRHGDFALAGVAIRVRAVDPERPELRIVAFGISDKPVARDESGWLTSAVASVGPSAPHEELRKALSAQADDFATGVVDTGGDSHGSTAYRRQLVAALSSREIARAYAQATHTTSRQ